MLRPFAVFLRAASWCWKKSIATSSRVRAGGRRGRGSRLFHQAFAGHAKRLLHASFHRDPRELIEDVVRAQNECMESWEMDEANRAWDERREARFFNINAADAIKRAGSALLGLGAAAVDLVRNEGLPKNLRDDYTAFSLATIGYVMLYTTASALG